MKENSIKNERSSIKEDIKILEKKIEDYEPYKNIEYCSHAGQILQEEHKALEHILSDYKRVLKENEYKTEKIENQKSELAILNNKQKDFNKLQNTLNSYRGQFRRQEKEIKRLKSKLDEAGKINYPIIY